METRYNLIFFRHISIMKISFQLLSIIICLVLILQKTEAQDIQIGAKQDYPTYMFFDTLLNLQYEIKAKNAVILNNGDIFIELENDSLQFYTKDIEPISEKYEVSKLDSDLYTYQIKNKQNNLTALLNKKVVLAVDLSYLKYHNHERMNKKGCSNYFVRYKSENYNFPIDTFITKSARIRRTTKSIHNEKLKINSKEFRQFEEAYVYDKNRDLYIVKKDDERYCLISKNNEQPPLNPCSKNIYVLKRNLLKQPIFPKLKSNKKIKAKLDALQKKYPLVHYFEISKEPYFYVSAEKKGILDYDGNWLFEPKYESIGFIKDFIIGRNYPDTIYKIYNKKTGRILFEDNIAYISEVAFDDASHYNSIITKEWCLHLKNNDRIICDENFNALLKIESDNIKYHVTKVGNHFYFLYDKKNKAYTSNKIIDLPEFNKVSAQHGKNFMVTKKRNEAIAYDKNNGTILKKFQDVYLKENNFANNLLASNYNFHGNPEQKIILLDEELKPIFNSEFKHVSLKPNHYKIDGAYYNLNFEKINERLVFSAKNYFYLKAINLEGIYIYVDENLNIYDERGEALSEHAALKIIDLSRKYSAQENKKAKEMRLLDIYNNTYLVHKENQTILLNEKFETMHTFGESWSARKNKLSSEGILKIDNLKMEKRSKEDSLFLAKYSTHPDIGYNNRIGYKYRSLVSRNYFKTAKYINNEKRVIFEDTVFLATNFSNGYALIQDKSSRYKFIDTLGCELHNRAIVIVKIISSQEDFDINAFKNALSQEEIFEAKKQNFCLEKDKIFQDNIHCLMKDENGLNTTALQKIQFENSTEIENFTFENFGNTIEVKVLARNDPAKIEKRKSVSLKLEHYVKKL